MAYFRLRVDAQNWFSELRKYQQFKVMFDLYYFCLMAGFATDRSSEQGLAGAGATDMVEDFTSEHKPAKLLLIGLLVIAELKKEGIDVSEKTAVRSAFRRLVDPANPSQLTDFGTRRMNAYASGGYEYLAECRDAKPYTPDEFLRDYMNLVRQHLEAGRTGASRPGSV